MSNVFSVRYDHRDPRVKFIVCDDKGLHVQVLKKNLKLTEVPNNALQLSAVFYNETLEPEEMIKKAKHVNFLIINADSPRSSEWSMPLFNEAIDFYCQNYLKIPHSGIDYTSEIWKWYPFETEDDLDCIGAENIVQPTGEQLEGFMKDQNWISTDSSLAQLRRQVAFEKGIQHEKEGSEDERHENSNI